MSKSGNFDQNQTKNQTFLKEKSDIRLWSAKADHIIGEWVVLTTCVPNMRFGETGGVEDISNMTKMIPKQHWLSAEYKPESRTQKYSECQTPQCGKKVAFK